MDINDFGNEQKIAIVTFCMANNHGALLQCFALQALLERLGYKAIIINYYDANIANDYKVFNFLDEKRKFSLRLMFSSLLYFPILMKRYQSFENFRKKYLNMSVRFNDIADICVDLKNISCWIAGSDQIWNVDITNGVDDFYTLNIPGISGRKISYAASIGKLELQDAEKKEFYNKLSSLDAISVREKSAQNTLKDIFPNKEIAHVVDPVLLFDESEWEGLLNIKGRIYKKKYILVYLFGYNEDAIKTAKQLQKITGLPIVHFGHRNKYFNEVLDSSFTFGPDSFVNLVKYAEFIVSESFHCTAFSVIFKKNFWTVFPNTDNHSRIYELLDGLGLKKRLIEQNEMDVKDLKEEIDYTKAHEKLKVMRKDSYGWLLESIKEDV